MLVLPLAQDGGVVSELGLGVVVRGLGLDLVLVVDELTGHGRVAWCLRLHRLAGVGEVPLLLTLPLDVLALGLLLLAVLLGRATVLPGVDTVLRLRLPDVLHLLRLLHLLLYLRLLGSHPLGHELPEGPDGRRVRGCRNLRGARLHERVVCKSTRPRDVRRRLCGVLVWHDWSRQVWVGHVDGWLVWLRLVVTPVTLALFRGKVSGSLSGAVVRSGGHLLIGTNREALGCRDRLCSLLLIPAASSASPVADGPLVDVSAATRPSTCPWRGRWSLYSWRRLRSGALVPAAVDLLGVIIFILVPPHPTGRCGRWLLWCWRRFRPRPLIRMIRLLAIIIVSHSPSPPPLGWCGHRIRLRNCGVDIIECGWVNRGAHEHGEKHLLLCWRQVSPCGNAIGPNSLDPGLGLSGT